MQALGGVNPNPALFGNRLHAFLAPDVEKVGEAIPTGAPRRRWSSWSTGASCPGSVRDGVVDHALVVAALSLLELHEALRREPAG